MVSKQMHLPPPCYSFAAIGRAGPRAPCFAKEVHALSTSMREFIKVQNTFKLLELCNSLLKKLKSIAIVILELIKYLIS